MPIGFANSILGAGASAAADAGYWQNDYYHSHANKASHPMVDKGVGQNWNASSGTFSTMFWMKGTTSNFDSAYNNQQIMRSLASSSGDNGIFGEVTASGFVVGNQRNNSTFKLIIWQPASFSANYLDDEWHHYVFQLNLGSSKVFVDGVDKSGEATLPSAGSNTPNGITRYMSINGGPTSYNSGAYTGFRTGKFQFADFWLKMADAGTLDFANNGSHVYGGSGDGWNDLGTNGNADSNIPTPDIFLRLSGGSLIQSGATGTVSILEGTTSANLTQSSTGGPQG